MYNIHNKSTSRYHFDSCFRCHRCRRFVCNFNWRLFGCGACKTKANKKTAATQLCATKWTYIYVHFFTWHSFFLLLYDVDHNVYFVMLPPLLLLSLLLVVWWHSWARNEHANLCSIIAYLSLWSQTFPLRSVYLSHSLRFSISLRFFPFAPSIPDYLFFSRQNFPFKIIEMVEWAWCSHSWCHHVS